MQGCQASHRVPGAITGSLGLSQEGRASHRDIEPLIRRLGLSQGGHPAHKEAGPLTRRQGLLQGGWASIRESGPLTGRPGFSQGGRASLREARPLTERPGLSQGGQASNREARPQRGRPGLSQCSVSGLAKNTNKNSYSHKSLKYQLRKNCNILDFATKHQKHLPCRPHKIPLASEHCFRVPALLDSLRPTPWFLGYLL